MPLLKKNSIVNHFLRPFFHKGLLRRGIREWEFLRRKSYDPKQAVCRIPRYLDNPRRMMLAWTNNMTAGDSIISFSISAHGI
jgi:hypothetical protein